MLSCRDYQDLLLDYSYGLLESDESERVRAHAATCPSCQADLRQLETNQLRVRRVLRKDIPVPVFTPPESDVLPFTPRREAVRRVWPRFVAAAVVLTAVGLGYLAYDQGLAKRESALAEARKNLEGIIERRDYLRRHVPVEMASGLRSQPGLSLRLQVFGPPTYHPGAANDYRVVTSSPDGQRLATQVKFRLVGKDGQTLYEGQDQASPGDLLVSLPATLARDAVPDARLEFEASRGKESVARVSTPFTLAEPAYRTHVALSNSVYHPGETVLVRSLTLEQVSLRPPEGPLEVTYEVIPPAGQSKRVKGLTHEGGVGTADFAVTGSTWPPGEYTLRVREERKRFPDQTCKFYVRAPEVVRLRQEIQLDRESYKPGDTVKATLRAQRLDNGQPAANEDVRGILRVDEKDTGKPLKLRTGADGTAQFEVTLPGNVGDGLVQLKLLTGKLGESDKVEKLIPLRLSRVIVEFFPEGGDLVAGVANRVYVRARSPLGQPVDLRGQVVDSRNQEVVPIDLSGGRGLGTFVLPARAGEAYALKVAEPEGINEVLPLPQVQEGRIGLHVPTGVTRPTEPIRAVLRHVGSPRPMLVGVFCRGRLVAQQLVTVSPGETEVQLQPTPSAAGVLRITVFDTNGPVIFPVAERLVYRTPGEGLRLTATPHQEQSKAGDHVRLDVESRDERNELAAAWLAVIVRQRSAHGPCVGSPQAFFHLLSQVRHPEDLEQADIAVQDDPRSLAALDLFLGTQGWRRFAIAGEQAPAVKQEPILRLDTADEIDRGYSKILAFHSARWLTEDRALGQAQEKYEGIAQGAAVDLQRFQEGANLALGVGVRFGLLVAFLGAMALLLWNLVRVLRAQPAFRLAVGGASTVVLLAPFAWFALEDHLGIAVDPVGSQASVKPPEWAVPPGGLVAKAEPLPIVVPDALKDNATLLPREQVASAATAHEAPRGPVLGSPPSLLPFSPRRATSDQHLPIRVYAYEAPKNGPANPEAAPAVLFWHPYLQAEDGKAQVEFDLPAQAEAYQVLIHGHTANGRLGVGQGRIDVRGGR
jgi:hypothetical protein